jgi:glutaconate CoA-transferase, subunit B
VSAPATLHERLAVALSRTFRDGEVGFTGLTTGGPSAMFGTMIPLAAMELARKTHAPSFTILLAGWIHNPNVASLRTIPDAEFAPALLDLECEAQSGSYPAQWSIKRGDIDVGFASGAQVDREGSINSVSIGDPDRPTVRLVGPILQPEHMTLFGREIVVMPRHDRRTIVERVDYVSGLGYPGGRAGRRALGLERGGPELIVTPLCIFDFDAEKAIRVRSIHPGVTEAELREATGFELGDLSDVPSTGDPTADELEVLRREVCPHGLLNERVPISGTGLTLA